MLPLEFDGLLIDGILLFLLANGYYCAIFTVAGACQPTGLFITENARYSVIHPAIRCR